MLRTITPGNIVGEDISVSYEDQTYHLGKDINDYKMHIRIVDLGKANPYLEIIGFGDRKHENIRLNIKVKTYIFDHDYDTYWCDGVSSRINRFTIVY